MMRDAIPNALDQSRVKPEKAGRYVVVLTEELTHNTFSGAFACAESRARENAEYSDGQSFAICKLDSTVQLLNGVIVVRCAE